MLLLSFAVVGWGLHYKLSLYASSHAAPLRAKAKLLTEQERSTAEQMEATKPQPPQAPCTALSLLLFAALLRLLPVLCPARSRSTRDTRLIPGPLLPHVLYRRPPPACFNPASA